jgi:hypothetical protein
MGTTSSSQQMTSARSIPRLSNLRSCSRIRDHCGSWRSFPCQLRIQRVRRSLRYSAAAEVEALDPGRCGYISSSDEANKPHVYFSLAVLMLMPSRDDLIQRYVNLLVERLHEKTSFARAVELDISPWFNYTTFDIFGDLGFGESFECLEHSRYHPWIRLPFNSVKAAGFIVSARFHTWIQFLLMKCIPPSLKQAQKGHYQQIVEEVNRRCNWELDRPDLMSHVIQ